MRAFASTLLAAAMAAQAVIATPIRARSPYAVKETHFAPREWTKLDRASGAKLVQLQIGLKQGNMVGSFSSSCGKAPDLMMLTITYRTAFSST